MVGGANPARKACELGAGAEQEGHVLVDDKRDGGGGHDAQHVRG